MEDCHCKREVEEEEAMALAQVQSLVEADQPHPPISIAPPSQTVVVHVQPDMVGPCSVSTIIIVHVNGC